MHRVVLMYMPCTTAASSGEMIFYIAPLMAVVTIIIHDGEKILKKKNKVTEVAEEIFCTGFTCRLQN